MPCANTTSGRRNSTTLRATPPDSRNAFTLKARFRFGAILDLVGINVGSCETTRGIRARARPTSSARPFLLFSVVEHVGHRSRRPPGPHGHQRRRNYPDRDGAHPSKGRTGHPLGTEPGPEDGPRDFFGEGCLAGQSVRMGRATAVVPTTVLSIDKKKMLRLLHEQHTMSDFFISYILARNIRIEEDLVDQLFNSSEKRLARTLLLLAQYGVPNKPQRLLPKLSQEVLAEMVGTTRSRVNFFMNKFRKLGFIDYNGGVRVNSSLLSVVLHD
jgi:CRP-like cAMP-binding protein